MTVLRQARAVAAAFVLSASASCDKAGDPIRWRAELDGRGTISEGERALVLVRATPQRGWYFYSLTQPSGGPISARIWLSDTTRFRMAGAVRASAPQRSFDKTFSMNVEKYPSPTSFIVPIAMTDARGGRAEIVLSATYQACNDTICLSPRTVTLNVPVEVRPH